MSLNWVMLDETKQGKFIPLPRETTLFTSLPRVALSLAAPGYAAKPYKLQCKDGIAFLTSSRLVYIPTTTTPGFESFSSPMKNIFDSYVQTPMFGPNVWCCTIQAVSGGGLPSGVQEFELKLTFKEGGAYDFHSAVERAKENLHMQMEYGYAAEEATAEDLPSYDGGMAGAPGYSSQPPGHHQQGPPPDGPPPGYEEAQMHGLTSGLENYTERP